MSASVMRYASVTVPVLWSCLTQLSIYIYLTVQDGFSPLYVASQFGHTDVLDLLLKAGADVHQMAKVLPLYMPPTCTCGAVLLVCV